MSSEQKPQRGNLLGFMPELSLYYLLVALYFFAFGMQFVLFPSLVAFFLNATATGVGPACERSASRPGRRWQSCI